MVVRCLLAVGDGDNEFGNEVLFQKVLVGEVQEVLVAAGHGRAVGLIQEVGSGDGHRPVFAEDRLQPQIAVAVIQNHLVVSPLTFEIKDRITGQIGPHIGRIIRLQLNEVQLVVDGLEGHQVIQRHIQDLLVAALHQNLISGLMVPIGGVGARDITAIVILDSDLHNKVADIHMDGLCGLDSLITGHGSSIVISCQLLLSEVAVEPAAGHMRLGGLINQLQIRCGQSTDAGVILTHILHTDCDAVSIHDQVKVLVIELIQNLHGDLGTVKILGVILHPESLVQILANSPHTKAFFILVDLALVVTLGRVEGISGCHRGHGHKTALIETQIGQDRSIAVVDLQVVLTDQLIAALGIPGHPEGHYDAGVLLHLSVLVGREVNVHETKAFGQRGATAIGVEDLHMVARRHG